MIFHVGFLMYSAGWAPAYMAQSFAILPAKRHHFQSLDLLFILQTLSLDLCDLSAIGSAKLTKTSKDSCL
jgi:hypothetical protein